jgi:uncharacterized membrane protein YhaH (DUF805 family)
MEDVKTAVRIVLSKYATFSGRASRPEFWWFALALFLASIVLGLVDAIIFGFEEDDPQILTGLLGLALFLPSIAVGVRRMHDIGRTGWWLLIGFIPIVGFFVLIYFYIQPSDTEANAYGSPEPFPASG